ncbi:heterokaryon incompatibility, partial [Lojkania enalia]
FEDPIELTLSTRSLSDVPEYEALSYVWGIEKCKSPVTVNDCSQVITENLDIALRHLRLKSEPRTLWIDAVCINQEDVAERNYQVSLMGSIYSKASHVVVFLGPEADKSGFVMDCIASRYAEDSHMPYFIYYANKLAERPWFTRVWVVQEVALASEDPV